MPEAECVIINTVDKSGRIPLGFVAHGDEASQGFCLFRQHVRRTPQSNDAVMSKHSSIQNIGFSPCWTGQHWVDDGGLSAERMADGHVIATGGLDGVPERVTFFPMAFLSKGFNDPAASPGEVRPRGLKLLLDAASCGGRLVQNADLDKRFVSVHTYSIREGGRHLLDRQRGIGWLNLIGGCKWSSGNHWVQILSPTFFRTAKEGGTRAVNCFMSSNKKRFKLNYCRSSGDMWETLPLHRVACLKGSRGTKEWKTLVIGSSGERRPMHESKRKYFTEPQSRRAGWWRGRRWGGWRGWRGWWCRGRESIPEPL